MTITYNLAPTELTFDVPETPLQVKLDGHIVGLIRKTTGGFAYYPKGAGHKGRGDVYPTLDACKRSLEGYRCPGCGFVVEHEGEFCGDCTQQVG